MTIESPHDIAGLLQIGKIVGSTLRALEQQIQPGMTTKELDDIAGRLLAAERARSAPIMTYAFPGQICISVNSEAAHGIPGPRVIRPGDIVKIDVSAERDGYFADAALTALVPPVAPRSQRLYDAARRAFDAALAAARAGEPISAIGRAAEGVARQHGASVIQDLPGHGVGRALHEPPSIPMSLARSARAPLTDGLVITIEPHVAAGQGRLRLGADGWTLSTRDGSHVAAYEHTIIVTHGQPIIITA